MQALESVEVFYPGSTYVWCRGESTLVDRHPIFVSSPVRFMLGPNGRYTLLTCKDATCSLCGTPTPYQESDLGFQDEVASRSRIGA